MDRSRVDEVEDDEANQYVTDTESNGGFNPHNDRDHQRLCNNRQGMRREQPREVRDRDDPLRKIKFIMPPFARKYDPDAYLNWELAVEQKFLAMISPMIRKVGLLLVSLLILHLFGGMNIVAIIRIYLVLGML